MKKLLSFLFIAASFSIIAKDGFKIIKSEANSVTVEYTFSGMDQQSVNINGKNYQKIYATGCVPVLNVGFPQVLRSSVSLAIPNNAFPKLEILSNDYSEVNNVALAPSKGSLTRNINPEEIPYVFGNVYQKNSFYPADPAAINSTYLLRDQKGVSLSIFPVQTNPVTNKLRVINKIVFKISYVSANGRKINFNAPTFTSNEEKELMTNRFLNLPSVLANAKVQYTPINEFGDMLILYHPAFLTNIQPLADWKNQKGIKTELVSSATSGTTYAQVQTYIQNYYASHPNLLYVLIVGDHEQINAYNAGPSGSETKWSDSYYGLLSGNDHYPEIMVGRFSSALATDITTMVNRTLEYEKTPMAGSWYTKGIGIGSNQGYGIGDEGEADWQHIRKIGNKLVANGYTYFHEFYDSSHAGNDAAGDPNATMVSNAVNGGSSIFLYCGHGAQNVCVTSNYSSSNINAATNNGMYPFSVQVACNNGTFIGGTCLSETFLRAKNATGPTGAIASAGSSILMAWAEPMDTEDEIGDIISDQYLNNKKYTMGGLFYNGQMHMLDDYPTATGDELMETWVLFGDPSCMFRCLVPTNITANHDPCIQQNVTSFSVTSSFGVNTYASISQNNQIIGASLITSANTNIALTQTFSTSQSLLLTITEYNKLPYIVTLPVCLATGINELATASEFFVESPVGNTLNFNYKNVEAKELTLEVIDMQGKLVISSTFDNISSEGNLKMNTEALSSGVYLLKVSGSNSVLKTIKIVKE
ncbi:MAG: T9SS type A sorting domain-containing protein [Bacteroidetes bacterium]|nr:T9SS type A sorting domain-containing protein [Bacteroidota bacterium]